MSVSLTKLIKKITTNRLYPFMTADNYYEPPCNIIKPPRKLIPYLQMLFTNPQYLDTWQRHNYTATSYKQTSLLFKPYASDEYVEVRIASAYSYNIIAYCSYKLLESPAHDCNILEWTLWHCIACTVIAIRYPADDEIANDMPRNRVIILFI